MRPLSTPQFVTKKELLQLGSGGANLALGTATDVTQPITNSNGTGVILPSATQTLAGLLNAGDKTKIDNLGTTYVQVQSAVYQPGNLRMSGNGIFNGWIGLSTPDPTHPLTFSNTAVGGIAHYNTADQVTNYERFRTYWASNVFSMITEAGGTGVGRAINIIPAGNLSLGAGSNARMVIQGANIAGQLSLNGAINVTSNSSSLGFTGGYTNSAGTANAIAILNTVTPTGTGGYRGMWISPVISGSATGARFLIDAGTNTTGGGTGTHTSVFSVTPTGAVTAALDVEITNLNNGIILKAPGGVRWRVRVNDTGVLTTTSL